VPSFTDSKDKDPKFKKGSRDRDDALLWVVCHPTAKPAMAYLWH